VVWAFNEDRCGVPVAVVNHTAGGAITEILEAREVLRELEIPEFLRVEYELPRFPRQLVRRRSSPDYHGPILVAIIGSAVGLFGLAFFLGGARVPGVLLLGVGLIAWLASGIWLLVNGLAGIPSESIGSRYESELHSNVEDFCEARDTYLKSLADLDQH
jgi:hypothetical protein